MKTVLIHTSDNKIDAHTTNDKHPLVMLMNSSVGWSVGMGTGPVKVEERQPTFVRMYAKDYDYLSTIVPEGSCIQSSHTDDGFYTDVGYIAMPGSLLSLVIHEHNQEIQQVKVKLKKSVSLANSLSKVLDVSTTEINNLTYANNKLREEVNNMNTVLNSYHNNSLINKVKHWFKR